MARKGILVLAIVFALIATVSALSIPPVVQISATPNNPQITSTIVAVAVDLSGSGIAWVKVYEDGALKKECSTSTCVYVSVHASAGTHSYYAKTSDNGGRETTSSTTSVTFTNSAPVLNPIGERNVTNETLLQFQISGYDYNNDALAYSATGLPSGASFNPTTQIFTWTPTTAQIGSYQVNFSVSDGYLSDSELVTINVVSSVNHAPILDAIGNKAGTNGSLLTFTITGSDPDGGDILTFSAIGLPAGATFNAGTRTFTWTPTSAQIGIHYVNFSVSDGQLSDSERIMINITNSGNGINHAPVLDAIGNKIISDGHALTFTVNASDIDGDSLTYFATGVPAGANFNAGTRTFTWTPTSGQIGVHYVNFTVSDGALSDSERIAITVLNSSDDTTGPLLYPNGAWAVIFDNHVWIVSALEAEDPSGLDSAWINFNGALFYSEFSIYSNFEEALENKTSEGNDFLLCDSSHPEGICFFGKADAVPGNYTYTWYANDTMGNENNTGELFFEFKNDTPKYYNLTESPADPATYSSGQTYEFNVTWVDSDEIADVYITFNGVNYPDYYWKWGMSESEINEIIESEGGILLYNHFDNGSPEAYSFRTKNLSIGTYNYTWYAEDYVGNTNNTGILTYTVIEQGHNDDDDDSDGDDDDNKIIIIDDDDFEKGIYIDMDVGDKIKFTFCGSPYYIKLTETQEDDDEAYFLLTPLMLKMILREHQSEEIDLNGDGIKDILFRLERVSGDSARVYLKRISNVCLAPSEDSGLLVYTGDNLNPAQGESTGVMGYIALALMFGILLLALAVLLYLIDRAKRMQRRKPAGAV